MHVISNMYIYMRAYIFVKINKQCKIVFQANATFTYNLKRVCALFYYYFKRVYKIVLNLCIDGAKFCLVYPCEVYSEFSELITLNKNFSTLKTLI